MTLRKRIEYTKTFKKDWKKLRQSGKANLKRAEALMEVLASGERPLPDCWRDHSLLGSFEGQREAHFGGDALILYTETDGCIFFERIGTHNQIFTKKY